MRRGRPPTQLANILRAGSGGMAGNTGSGSSSSTKLARASFPYEAVADVALAAVSNRAPPNLLPDRPMHGLPAHVDEVQPRICPPGAVHCRAAGGQRRRLPLACPPGAAASVGRQIAGRGRLSPFGPPIGTDVTGGGRLTSFGRPLGTDVNGPARPIVAPRRRALDAQPISPCYIPEMEQVETSSCRR